MLFVALVFVAFLVGFIILTSLSSNKIQSEQSNKEEILYQEGSKNALILYQDSLLGLTKGIIEETAKILGGEGYRVTLNHPRSDLTYKITDYDLVVLASPVYAKKVASPIMEYARNHDFTNTRVLVVVTGKLTEETSEIEEIMNEVNLKEEINGFKIDGIAEEYKDFLMNINA